MSVSKWKPYSDYKTTTAEWIPEVPIDWDIVPLKFLCNIKTGDKDSIDENPNGNYPFFVRSQLVRRISSFSYDGEGILTAGDGNIGEIFHYVNGKFDFHQRVYLFHQFENVSAKYLYYFLKANLKEVVLALSAKSTVDSIRLPMLTSFPVALPPEEEALTIHNFLEENEFQLNQNIEWLEKQLKLFDEKRSALITQAVTKGLNPDVLMKETGLDWYPEVPLHWELRRVKHIATISPSNVDKKKYDGQEEVRLANYVDVYYNDRITGKLDLMIATASDNEIAKFSIKAGDMIITKDSETWDDIAVPAFVPATMEGVVCGYHLTLIRPNQEHILGEFLFRTYQAIGVQDQYYYNANGVTRYGLGSYWVDNGIVPVPPLKEQREIAEYIDKKLTLIEMIKGKITSKIEKLKEFQTALISAAVTGKIDVRGQA